MIGETPQLLGGDPQRFGGVVAHLGDDFVVQVGDDALHIVFDAITASAEVLVELAPEIFEATAGCICHDARLRAGLPAAFSIAGEDAAVTRAGRLGLEWEGSIVPDSAACILDRQSPFQEKCARRGTSEAFPDHLLVSSDSDP